MCETVQFDESAEYAFLLVLGNAATGVGNVEIKLFSAKLVAKADTPFLGELDGIGHQIDDQLGNTVLFQMNQAAVCRRYEFQFHSFGFHLELQRAFQLFHYGIQLDVGVLELKGAGFYFRQVEDVADQL